MCFETFLGSLGIFFFLGLPLPSAACASPPWQASAYTPHGAVRDIYSWEGNLVQMKLSLTQMFTPLAEGTGTQDLVGVACPPSFCLSPFSAFPCGLLSSRPHPKKECPRVGPIHKPPVPRRLPRSCPLVLFHSAFVLRQGGSGRDSGREKFIVVTGKEKR